MLSHCYSRYLFVKAYNNYCLKPYGFHQFAIVHFRFFDIVLISTFGIVFGIRHGDCIRENKAKILDMNIHPSVII
jgi:hypothetical protein